MTPEPIDCGDCGHALMEHDPIEYEDAPGAVVYECIECGCAFR